MILETLDGLLCVLEVEVEGGVEDTSQADESISFHQSTTLKPGLELTWRRRAGLCARPRLRSDTSASTPADEDGRRQLDVTAAREVTHLLIFGAQEGDEGVRVSDDWMTRDPSEPSLEVTAARLDKVGRKTSGQTLLRKRL
jgi:hypothetical protein